MTDLGDMTAVILCGGLGTRLREETEFKPKPMVTIGDRPILWHIMKVYRHYGVRRFVLCLGYRGDVIRNYFLDYRRSNSDFAIDMSDGAVTLLDEHDREDWRVVLAETGAATQTGARIKRALRYVEGDRFLATYGDGVADIDVAALVAHHMAGKRLATVTAVHPSSRFGELGIDGGRVTSFREKPQVHEGWINGGFLVFERSAFDRVGDSPDVILETGLLEQLAREGELGVYRHQGFWQCMDTYREMQLLNELWQSDAPPWRMWAS